MERKSTKVSENVKGQLEAKKRALGLKNESEVIAYLLAYYELHYESITLVEHQKILDRMREIEVK
jgi:hypothetical protein